MSVSHWAHLYISLCSCFINPNKTTWSQVRGTFLNHSLNQWLNCSANLCWTFARQLRSINLTASLAQKYSTQFAVAQWPRNSQQGEKNHFYGKDQTGRKKNDSSNNNYKKYVTKVERRRRQRRRRRRRRRCRSVRMRGNSDSNTTNNTTNNNKNDAKKWPLKLPGKWQKAEA